MSAQKSGYHRKGVGILAISIRFSVCVRFLPVARFGSAESRTNGCIDAAADGRFFRVNAGSQVRLSN